MTRHADPADARSAVGEVIRWFPAAALSKNAASLNEPDQDHDDGDYQQDVDETSQRGTGHQTEEPQDEKDDCEGH
jgi:hypothetical protein